MATEVRRKYIIRIDASRGCHYMREGGACRDRGGALEYLLDSFRLPNIYFGAHFM